MKLDMQSGATQPDAPLATMLALTESLHLVRTNPDSLLQEMMSDRNYIVSFVNAHAMNVACENSDFLVALRSSDVLLRDGVGMKILLKALGKEPDLNMNGTDFIPKLLLAMKHFPIAVCGSTAQTAASAAASLQRNASQPVVHCDGFRSAEFYLEFLRRTKPRIVILGMGMPKQELLSAMIARELPGPMLIINGGAILDFLSRRFRRAPRVMRRLGLEWLYRLILEPSRLWRRYLIGNFVFLWRTAQIVLQRRALRS